MTPVTKLEEWIAPRAVPLLAILSVLIIGVGVAAYFVREGDLNRVERLERVILCQHSHECREFVERAIREILHEQQKAVPKEKSGQKRRGVTFRLGPKEANVPSPLVVEVPDSEGGTQQPQGESPEPESPKPPRGPKPQNPSQEPPQGNAGSPAPPQGRSEPIPREAAPVPVEEPEPSPKGPVSSAGEKAEEVLEDIKKLPCTALREVHGLC